METAGRAELAATLGELQAKLAELEPNRRRSPVEAPRRYTSAYIDLLFAYGFARLGKPSADLVERARAALPLDDAVHGFLFAAFEARIAEAVRGGTPLAPLPAHLRDRFLHLDRVAQYKINRLREELRALGFAEADAVRAHGARRPDPEPNVVALGGLLAIDPPAARAARIEELAKDPLRLEVCFVGLCELPEDLAIPLWLQLADKCTTATHHAHALGVLARFAWGELVPRVVSELRATLPALEENARAPAIAMASHALVDLGLDSELASVIAEASELDRLDVACRALLAGVRSRRREQRGVAMFVELEAEFERDMALTDRLDFVRALADGYALADPSFGKPALLRLANTYRHISDSFGTNSHYCWAVLHFVGSLVLGVVDQTLLR